MGLSGDEICQHTYVVDVVVVINIIILKFCNDKLFKKPWLYFDHDSLLSIKDTFLLIKHLLENCI